MKPRLLLLALGYALAALAWLHLGLLALDPNDDRWHGFTALAQATFALVAAASTFWIPKVPGLVLHWIGLAGMAGASTALTVNALNEPDLFAAAHAAQSLGLLIALWYAIQWWLSSGGVRYARRFAAGHLLAALGTFAMIGLEFLGQGHPFRIAQRPYTAADDALLGLALVLCAWMGGIAALTLKTPEPVIKP